MPKETLYLSSLESLRLEPVRECELSEVLTFDTGKQAIRAFLRPGIDGQEFNRVKEIDSVILVARHEGVSISPISEFPCFVSVTISSKGYETLESPLSTGDLTIIGWGELYRTRHDAENHVF